MDHIELIKRHLADYSAGRWERYTQDLADDVRYEEAATQTTVTGRDDYVAAVKRWKRAFPDLSAAVEDVMVTGDKVMAEIEWQGTHTGPFEGPFGTLAPTHQRGSVKAALRFQIVDGKIVETRHYFDVLTVLVQLGAIPTLAASTTPPRPEAAAPPHH
jgi:steroid delta-isomerase-like uncharacterized protein